MVGGQLLPDVKQMSEGFWIGFLTTWLVCTAQCWHLFPEALPRDLRGKTVDRGVLARDWLYSEASVKMMVKWMGEIWRPRAKHQDNSKRGKVIQWSWDIPLASTYSSGAFYGHGNLMRSLINTLNLLECFFAIDGIGLFVCFLKAFPKLLLLAWEHSRVSYF